MVNVLTPCSILSGCSCALALKVGSEETIWCRFPAAGEVNPFTTSIQNHNLQQFQFFFYSIPYSFFIFNILPTQIRQHPPSIFLVNA
ncbi:hypothetical protein HanRHA438_Chr07g0300651 [Helianthus annuus]|nr:hypothetical protein HanIR_Chr07g0313001 [Helianthus annuus]KAJ0907575.1 hypothetical protein HanRHA438_Chr07g0300651 [Helianthus annuus]